MPFKFEESSGGLIGFGGTAQRAIGEVFNVPSRGIESHVTDRNTESAATPMVRPRQLRGVLEPAADVARDALLVCGLESTFVGPAGAVEPVPAAAPRRDVEFANVCGIRIDVPPLELPAVRGISPGAVENEQVSAGALHHAVSRCVLQRSNSRVRSGRLAQRHGAGGR